MAEPPPLPDGSSRAFRLALRRPRIEQDGRHGVGDCGAALANCRFVERRRTCRFSKRAVRLAERPAGAFELSAVRLHDRAHLLSLSVRQLHTAEPQVHARAGTRAAPA